MTGSSGTFNSVAFELDEAPPTPKSNGGSKKSYRLDLRILSDPSVTSGNRPNMRLTR